MLRGVSSFSRFTRHYSLRPSLQIKTTFRCNSNSNEKPVDWITLKEIHDTTKFSFPEIESLLVQFNRRRADKNSNVMQKEDFARVLGPLGIEASPETVGNK